VRIRPSSRNASENATAAQRATKDPKHNTSPDMIANLEETADCQGHWIKASVEANGRYTIVNGRNGFSKTYMAR
jgi:hypothetical protein